MKFIYLVWIVAQTTWSPTEVKEYRMPSMEACLESVKAAKIANNVKSGTVSLFCIVKDN